MSVDGHLDAERVEEGIHAEFRAWVGRPAPLVVVWSALNAHAETARRARRTALAAAQQARIGELRPEWEAHHVAVLAAAEAAERDERAAGLASQRVTAELIATAPAAPVPVLQTWKEAGQPDPALFYGRHFAPSRPVLARFSHDGSRVYDARTGTLVAHFASPVPMWLAAAPETTAGAPPGRPVVVIIPCGGRKAPGRQPARRKYVGTYHLSARRAAEAIAGRSGAQILTLSALYGLCEDDRELDDYDLTMGQPGSVSATEVADQAAALRITDAMVLVVAGKRYADVVSAVWPHAVRLLDGTSSMGDQMARMKAIGDGVWSPRLAHAFAAATIDPAQAPPRS